MFPVMKNAFLQLELGVNPRLINRAVHEAMLRPAVAEDTEPPFLPSACQTPCVFAPDGDPTRARPAFLHWAIPKLTRDLHSKDLHTQMKSVAALSDFLRDPEQAYSAVKYNVIPRLADLMLHEQSYIRERTVLVLGILSNHALGGRRVLEVPLIPKNLQILLTDYHPMVQSQACNTVEILTRKPWVADNMLPLGFMKSVRDTIYVIELEAPCVVLLEAMHNLVERDPDMGVDLQILDQMMSIITREVDDERMIGQSCKVIAQLGVCAKGQREADVKDIIPTIIEQVYDEREKVHTSATMAFQSITVSTYSRWRCREFQDLPYRLTELATHRKNLSLQYYALQGLQNICAMPSVRECIRVNLYETINSIQTDHCPILDRYKARLIKNIQWTPYDISSIFDGPDPRDAYSEEEEGGSAKINYDFDGEEHIEKCYSIPSTCISCECSSSTCEEQESADLDLSNGSLE